jgi:class 3 adenylate cyclase
MERISHSLDNKTSHRKNTEAELTRLLKKRLAHPESIEMIDAQIQKTFVETHAILDMSGFSRLVEEFFIIHTLAQIQQMRGVVVPIVETHQGEILKLEADNVYAIFPQVHDAVAAATQMIQQLAQVGIHASIGIGYGELIMIADDKGGKGSKDAFGNQMNLASKLGEDLAKADEVLLTEAAFQQIIAPTTHWQLEEMQVSSFKLQVWRSLQPPLTGGINTTSSPL